MNGRKSHGWGAVLCVLLCAAPGWAQPPGDGDAVQRGAEQPAPSEPVVVPPRPLEVPQAVYPPAALEAGLEADVALSLDVSAEGSVTSAKVLSPVGHGFEEAAVEAVLQMRFDPATVDGVPQAVRIAYTYRFTIERKVVLPEPEPEPPPVTVRGKVLERGTRNPLAGVAVIVRETGETVLTGREGDFALRLPPGRTVLEVPVDSHKPFNEAVQVPEAGVVEVTLWLTRDSYAAFKTVVKQPKIEREVSKKTLKAAEIQKVPGNSGDALKVIQTLPGVARNPFGVGRPIIRGSSPEDTKAYLDGHLMPLLFHFGGLYAVINTDLIADLEYWPGGFSVRHGNAIGGLINVALRAPKLDRWHGIVETNLYHASVMAEGPLGEHTGLALSLRRSYVDVLLEAYASATDQDLGLALAPRYYDYQARLTHDFSPTNRLSVLWYGSDDALRFVFDEPLGEGGEGSGTVGTKINFHLLSGIWEMEVERGLDLRTSFRTGYTGGDLQVGNLLNIDVHNAPVDLKTELDWAVSEHVNLTLGAQSGLWYFSFDFDGPSPPKEGKPPAEFDASDNTRLALDGFVGYGAVYAEASIRLFDRVTVIPGLRVDAFGYLESGYMSVDPRLALRVELLEGTIAKAFVGLHHQPPQFDEWSEDIGNPALGPERSLQVSLGIEQRLTEHLNIDLQGFYKRMSQLVTPADFITEGVLYRNTGQGRVHGLELMVKHDLSRYFFGWLSYTLMRAERRDGPEDSWRLFDFDQSHILTLVAVFRLGGGWEAGLRFRYVTGMPQTPIESAVYDSDNDGYLPILGPTNSTRVGAFHQLDVRVDKKFVFDTWMFDVYLELVNVYAQPNPEGIDHNFDYSESRLITGIPFLPNLGLRAEF